VRTSAKLAAYGAVLAIVVGGGAGIGVAAGPIDVSDDLHGDVHATDSAANGAELDAPAATAAAELPGGLAVAQDGYRLDAPVTTVTGEEPTTFRFRVVDDTGTAVTRFDVEHEKRLHLVVVGRNLVDYAHVHPTLAEDGTWSVDLPALPAGSYRAFADFTPTGDDALTLGVDLTLTGALPANDLPAPSDRSEVEGYQVALEGTAQPGESELAFTVSRGGEHVRTDPYLGAAGHLVAIRDGDLAYLHVHPIEGEGDEVRFGADFPAPGTYRLFLDFAHGGAVHTAAFTVEVPAPGAAPADPERAPSPPADDEHESH
jgi:hypothetical protein